MARKEGQVVILFCAIVTFLDVVDLMNFGFAESSGDEDSRAFSPWSVQECTQHGHG